LPDYTLRSWPVLLPVPAPLLGEGLIVQKPELPERTDHPLDYFWGITSQ
jgi:hypothetical protein